MIKVTIERVSVEQYKELVNYPTHSEPALGADGLPVYKDGYTSERQPMMKTDFEPKEVARERKITTTLLIQEIADDSQFDLTRVISAINKINGS